MLYGIKDCANLALKNKATQKVELYSDYANVSTNEWTSERVYANAKGTRSIAWDYDKQSTLAVEMEIFDLKWIALMSGSDIVGATAENPVDIFKREVFTTKTGALTATLAGTPVEGSLSVFKLENDLVSHEAELEVAEAAETGKFTATGAELVLADEGNFVAYYLVKQTTGVKTIAINADKFPKAYEVIADTLIREKESGADEFVQIHYPNARPQGNFTITMSATEPTNLSVTFDLFPDANKDIATYKVIE